MNPVIWGGAVVVVLLGFIVGVTMGKTKWKRSALDQQAAGLPGNKGRVSGGSED